MVPNWAPVNAVSVEPTYPLFPPESLPPGAALTVVLTNIEHTNPNKAANVNRLFKARIFLLP